MISDLFPLRPAQAPCRQSPPSYQCSTYIVISFFPPSSPPMLSTLAPPPRSPNVEFVSFPANSRVVNAQRIHDNILCVLLLQPYKLWLFCRICLLVGPDPDFQVLILKYFLTPLKLLICTLYENCYPILLNFSNIVSCYFHLLAACFFFSSMK